MKTISGTYDTPVIRKVWKRLGAHSLVASACAVLIGLFLVPSQPATAATPTGTPVNFATIAPGQHPVLHLVTPVNLVFIGYQPSSVDIRRILSQLPAQGDPLVREPNFRGIHQDVGIRYDYRYNVRFAGKAFDDAFFGYLTSIAIQGPLDFFQQFYNEEQHNALDVSPQIDYLDANATEAWLEQQSQARLGIPSSQDTVFLVNWYGRPDFQFHDYYHLGHTDPDTGVDGGIFSESLVRAWGGNSGPTWFFDLSAGPVYADASWDVDDADVDGDGVPDYRIPPIWEYGNTTGYRPFTDLSGDLAKVIRYVAIDTMFSPSPLFDPAATVPGPDGSKQIQLDIFEGNPSDNGLGDVHPAIAQAEVQRLEPYYSGTSMTVTDQPLTGDVLDTFNIADGSVSAPGCWQQFGDPFAQLFCYFRDHRTQYFTAPTGDAVIPETGFTVPDPILFDFSGDTDDDWQTGAPSFIYMLDTPDDHTFSNVAYTNEVIHETGHYLGLSHPHDGYDSATGVDFEPSDDFYFAWIGDESSTVMSYLEGDETYDQFDIDNQARWQVARLLDLADTDTAAILAKPHSVQADLRLVQADLQFTKAVIALHLSDWTTAATAAVAGYRDIQLADAAVGVTSASAALAPAKAATAQAQALNSDTPTRPRIDSDIARKVAKDALLPFPAADAATVSAAGLGR
jgi:hypothetical protein